MARSTVQNIHPKPEQFPVRPSRPKSQRSHVVVRLLEKRSGVSDDSGRLQLQDDVDFDIPDLSVWHGR